MAKVSRTIIVTGTDGYQSRHEFNDYPKSIDKLVKEKVLVLNALGIKARIAPKPYTKNKDKVTSV